MSYAQDRIKRLRESMREQGIDVFYIRDLSNIKWATAFDGVFDDEDAHALIVTAEEAVLHTDFRYAQAAQDAAQKEHSIAVDAQAVNHAGFLDSFLAERFPEKELLFPVIGIESSMRLGEYRQLEKAPKLFRETSNFLIDIRSVKDSEEIRRLRYAQSITDAAFAHIISFIRPGLTEREVQVELEDYMIRHGATGLAFSSIVAAGANGANPHAIPGETILQSGQTLVLDFGARAQGYCSDMTRTVFMGEPDQRQREAYQALCEANEKIEAFLRPGVTGAEAQNCAEDILAQAGFGGKMGHSLGHGVGIDIHEEPVLAGRNTNALVAGNVVTVEPGIYIPHEFGMRLEDFGVITETGFDVFTQTSHDMVII